MRTHCAGAVIIKPCCSIADAEAIGDYPIVRVVTAGADSGSCHTSPAKWPTRLAKIGGIGILLDGGVAGTVTHVTVVDHIDVDSDGGAVKSLEGEVGIGNVELGIRVPSK